MLFSCPLGMGFSVGRRDSRNAAETAAATAAAGLSHFLRVGAGVGAVLDACGGKAAPLAWGLAFGGLGLGCLLSAAGSAVLRGRGN